MHTAEPRADTTRQSHVLVDVGGDAGALVLHTRGRLEGVEIELSREGDTRSRVHAAVHARELGGATTHAAVYPTLAAGTYVVWRNARLRWAEVDVIAGRVTEVGLL